MWVRDRALRRRSWLVAVVAAFAFLTLAGLGYALVRAAVVVANTVGLSALSAVTGRTWTGAFYVERWVGVVVSAGAVAAVAVVVGRSLPSRVDARPPAEANRWGLPGRVADVAATVGVATPTVAVSPQATPNAFTCGVVGDERTVVVTEGLLDVLDGEELDAVLAHELAHCRNGDVWSYSAAAVALALLSRPAAVGRAVLSPIRAVGEGGGRTRRALALVLAVASLPVTLPLVGPYLAVRLAVVRGGVRYRESATDVAAGAVTEAPDALADALRAVDAPTGSDPDALATPCLDVCYVAPVAADRVTATVAAVVGVDPPSTHPPTSVRVDHLRAFASGDPEIVDESAAASEGADG